MDPDKLGRMGRATRSGPLSEADYLDVIYMLKEPGIRLKINTVVTQINCDEDLSKFIAEARPGALETAAGAPGQGSERRTG